MDGLALLCNLCADGPLTLRRLRAACWSDLAAIVDAAPEALAACLHASLPQARAFAEEARRLAMRLAENERAPVPQSVSELGPSSIESSTPVDGEGPRRLVPGLFAGLDQAMCERLERQHVRTAQTLAEFAGVSLARRTGIPYAVLLEFSRQARRLPSAPRPSLATAGSVPELREVELLPFLSRPRQAPAEVELARSDEFTQPTSEPESAGPFG
jgi:hypothetical protein